MDDGDLSHKRTGPGPGSVINAKYEVDIENRVPATWSKVPELCGSTRQQLERKGPHFQYHGRKVTGGLDMGERASGCLKSMAAGLARQCGWQLHLGDKKAPAGWRVSPELMSSTHSHCIPRKKIGRGVVVGGLEVGNRGGGAITQIMGSHASIPMFHGLEQPMMLSGTIYLTWEVAMHISTLS